VLALGGRERPGLDAAVYRDQPKIEGDRGAAVGRGAGRASRSRGGSSPPTARPSAREKRWRPSQGGDDHHGAALPLLALGLYLTYGSPRLPDQPLAARLQDPASDRNLEALVARVEARLREHPEEGEGWA
jgi:cytochrome c-type biogenesis protein CcmH